MGSPGCYSATTRVKPSDFAPLGCYKGATKVLQGRYNGQSAKSQVSSLKSQVSSPPVKCLKNERFSSGIRAMGEPFPG
jgi:hypothetical protein